MRHGVQYPIWRYEQRVHIGCDGKVTKSYWVWYGNQWHPEGPFAISQQAFSKATKDGKYPVRVSVKAESGVEVL